MVRHIADLISISASNGHPEGAPAWREWSMGDDMWLTHVRHHGLAATNKRRPPGTPTAQRLVVVVPDDDRWTLRHGTHMRAADAGALVVADPSLLFDFRAFGTGTIVVLDLPCSWLTLPDETIHRGIDELRDTNPLVPFVRNHLVHLGRIGARHPDILPDLASPTVDMLRSLLLTSAQTREQSSAAELLVRVKLYISEHLTDRNLCADTIAADHNISVRKLYAEWPSEEGRLSNYIIRRRLERARDALITRRHLTVPAVARAHGFADPTHFTKRFRAAFGVSPSQWRRDNAGP
ncbi:helix-turn-helix domain-containing protein [Gordonia rhizosphera]|nr:AraC family transcriptional regulator [Gordonia rhizosphera]